jgi:hypothetical protein
MAVEVTDLCGQTLCTSDAKYSYVWPGRARAKLCEEHLATLRKTAEAIGLSLESLDIQPIGPVGNPIDTLGALAIHALISCSHQGARTDVCNACGARRLANPDFTLSATWQRPALVAALELATRPGAGTQRRLRTVHYVPRDFAPAACGSGGIGDVTAEWTPDWALVTCPACLEAKGRP